MGWLTFHCECNQLISNTQCLYGVRDSLQEKNVVRVYSSNGLLDSIVEGEEASMLFVCWLVERVISGYPGVVLIVLLSGSVSM
jgi:hypothetical protein